MKIAALYDIHSNLPALEAVLEEIGQRQIDLLVFGGDVVSGPLPRETIERLMNLEQKAVFVRGNGDREVVACFDGATEIANPFVESHAGTRWTARQLERRHRDFLASFVERAVVAVDGLGEVLFCHGSPRSDEEIFTAATPEERLRPMLANVTQRVVVCGHTHMQFDRRVGDVRIVNAGSVGMPYAARPGAYWAVLGPDIELRRTDYDFERAADLIRQSGMPGADEFADENVRSVPTAEEATALFERMAAERG